MQAQFRKKRETVPAKAARRAFFEKHEKSLS